jgi:alpha-1,6-mannosyltransferase
VERAARSAGGGVWLAGAMSDRAWLARAYASADALVHGSAAETFGLVVAEAMASGLPVVVPDAGGASDLARLGPSRIYRAGDADACGQAILDLLAEPRAVQAPPCISTAERHFSNLFELYEGLLTKV